MRQGSCRGSLPRPSPLPNSFENPTHLPNCLSFKMNNTEIQNKKMTKRIAKKKKAQQNQIEPRLSKKEKELLRDSYRKGKTMTQEKELLRDSYRKGKTMTQERMDEIKSYFDIPEDQILSELGLKKVASTTRWPKNKQEFNIFVAPINGENILYHIPSIDRTKTYWTDRAIDFENWASQAGPDDTLEYCCFFHKSQYPINATVAKERMMNSLKESLNFDKYTVEPNIFANG